MSDQIDKQNLPQHIAIIMDGNGRWAKAQGFDRIEGHRKGVLVAEDTIEIANDLGISYLTLYAFSQENWDRPEAEVLALMSLLKSFLLDKKQKMLDKGIRFNTIGRIHLLPQDIQDVIRDVTQATSVGTGMVLTLALSYGARDEILRAVSKLKDHFANLDNLSMKDFSSCLDTSSMPDPDLIVRTSGEKRISNFLLWQGAYAEYIFKDCNWPDFNEGEFKSCIIEYQRRERRFGKVSEQLRST